MDSWRGRRVVHTTYGHGTVLAEQDEPARVLVAFRAHGKVWVDVDRKLKNDFGWLVDIGMETTDPEPMYTFPEEPEMW